MAELTFERLKFNELEQFVRVRFLDIFSFEIPKKELWRIGKYSVSQNGVSFPELSQRNAEKQFSFLLGKGFRNLKNNMTGKNTVYVHRNSGLPLIGSIYFGVIDRGSNIIEVKPITGCNIKCTYCSVNEDVRPTDFVVEREYLVEEFSKLVNFKKVDRVEAHIASQGEPTLYHDLTGLVRDLASIPQVKEIAIDTNGTLLTPVQIDELSEAGITRFNLSINAIDPVKARAIAAAPYNIERVKDIARHIAKRTGLLIAPTYIPCINDEEIPKILGFVKELREINHKVMVGIQNFLYYKYGRNPAKPIGWDRFYDKIRQWEKDSGISLQLGKEDFSIVECKSYPKPFKKGNIVQAEILDWARIKGEKLAVAQGRIITIPHCTEEGKVKVKITRSKHNIFYGAVV